MQDISSPAQRLVNGYLACFIPCVLASLIALSVGEAPQILVGSPLAASQLTEDYVSATVFSGIVATIAALERIPSSSSSHAAAQIALCGDHSAGQ